MSLNALSKNKKDEPIELLIKNKGKYVYYVEFTDEIRLSTKDFGNGDLIIEFDKDTEFSLGPVTLIGEL
jgi:hypothetical protein